MATSANAKIQVETGQVLVPYAAMTDSGDHQTYTLGSKVWSGASGKEPDIRPNGIVTGVDLVTPAASGTNDMVDVAAFTAYSQGVLQTVAAATDVSITRGLTTDVCCITSITMTSAGAVEAVAGTDGTAFSETRGAAGGPPLIPVDSVELAQVRTGSVTAAAVTASEIYQVVGQHTERYDYPVWEVNPIGQGRKATASALTNAYVKLATAQSLSHTGPIARKIYAQVYTPTLSDLPKAIDFKPAEKTHSVSSTQYYGGSIASASESLGQGGFTAMLTDGIMDSLVGAKDDVRTVKFFQDKNKTPYVLTQGVLGLGRTFPVAGQVQAAVTISAEQPSAEFAS